MPRQGRWYLVPCINTEQPPASADAGFIGVDMGLQLIAATATITPDGTYTGDTRHWSGGAITLRRKKNQHLRSRLQHKGTKSAKRLLRKRASTEHRFAKDTNHVISKHIVAEAKRTGRGIAVENLTGIRERVRHRKPQRATMHSWAFAQLGGYQLSISNGSGVGTHALNTCGG